MKKSHLENIKSSRELSNTKLVIAAFVVLVILLAAFYQMQCSTRPLSREKITRNNTIAAIKSYAYTYWKWPISNLQIINSELKSYGTTFSIFEFRLQKVNVDTKDATFILIRSGQPHSLIDVRWPIDKQDNP